MNELLAAKFKCLDFIFGLKWLLSKAIRPGMEKKTERYQKQQANMKGTEGLEPVRPKKERGRKPKCMSLHFAISLPVALCYYSFYMNTPVNYVIKI